MKLVLLLNIIGLGNLNGMERDSNISYDMQINKIDNEIQELKKKKSLEIEEINNRIKELELEKQSEINVLEQDKKREYKTIEYEYNHSKVIKLEKEINELKTYIKKIDEYKYSYYYITQELETEYSYNYKIKELETEYSYNYKIKELENDKNRLESYHEASCQLI